MRCPFTFVELIIVLTLVMALSSIILPVVYRASLQAKSVLCSNNLAQIGTWLNTYTASNNDTILPYEGGWALPLAQIGRIVFDTTIPPANEFMCPSQPFVSIGDGDPTALWRGTNYGINQHIASELVNSEGNVTPWFALMHRNAVKDPASKVTIADSSGSNYFGLANLDPTVAGISRFGYTHADALPPNPAQPFPYHRHIDGTANFVFMDNHVEALAEWPRFMLGPGTFGYQMWHPEHDYPGSGLSE